MPWVTIGNIRGPQGPVGPQGPQGTAGAAGSQGPAGPAGQTGSQGPQGIQGPPGTAGADGTSVTIFGTVANAAALPTGLNSTTHKGRGYITDNDGHLHVWGGTSFTDVGLVRGPKGDTGSQGPTGPTGDTGPAGQTGSQGPAGAPGTRGSKWFTGNGTPGTIAGSLPGDMYLDQTTGDTYTLS